MSSFPPPQAGPEALLKRSADGLNPPADALNRIRGKIQSRMSAERALESARDALVPSASTSASVWAAVERGLKPVTTGTFWENLRDQLIPDADLASTVWSRVLPRLAEERVPARGFRPVKWVSAFALVAIIVRLSPLLVLAPRTVAESPITATRIHGQTSVLVGGLWQPIEGEMRLYKASRLSTGDGELTIVMHDDVVIRLAPDTVITLNDVSDRPNGSTGEPTIILEQGRIWVLGFAPKPLRPITVSTSQGWVSLQEGSLSVEQGTSQVGVRVWDRTATVTRRGISLSLLAGEELMLQKDGSLTPVRMTQSPYDDPWVSGNLSRDAVHQKEIAQMQQERRAANAGILPDSRLYPVKRLAEAVDVLLTYGHEARTRKVLDHANTRLNEAAALIAMGSGSHAETALEEFRTAVLSVASGSGDTVVSEILQSEVIAVATADTSAALPDDDAYLLKQAVRETIASLPDTVDKPDVTAAAVLDEVAQAKQTAHQGDTALAEAKLAEVRQTLTSLTLTGSSALLSPEAREELEATIDAAEISVSTDEQNRQLIRLPDTSTALTRRADPLTPSQFDVAPLTEEQIEDKVQRIRGQIFVFSLKRSQLNELREQIRSLDRHPDRGRILRRLYRVMPDNGLAQEVRRHIAKLDEENRKLQRELEEEMPTETGSGDTASY